MSVDYLPTFFYGHFYGQKTFTDNVRGVREGLVSVVLLSTILIIVFYSEVAINERIAAFIFCKVE